MTAPAGALVRHSSDRRQSTSRRRVVAGVLVGTVVLGGAAAGASQAATPNLVVNQGFEKGLSGWFARAPFSLERVSPGHGGDWAALLTNTGTTTRTGALNDTVNTVTDTAAGHVYHARAYVRADAPGRVVAVRVMEYRGTTFVGERSRTVTLADTAWHRVAVDYTAATNGASLDLNVLGKAVPAGGGFFVDDLRLSDTGPAAGAAQPGATASAGPTATVPASPSATATAPVATGTGVATSAPATSAPATSATASAPTTATASASPSRPAAPAGWRLVWSDEFDGALDPADWAVDHLSTFGDGNKELACLMNRPANVVTTGGTLSLRARHETTPLACGSNDSRFPGGRSYSSALVRTKQTWTYGRFEIRAKLPVAPGTSKGLWPGFWLRPAAGGTGELDILEAIGSTGAGNTSDEIHQTIWYDYVGTHPKETYTAVTGFDASAGWHTYAAEWEPGVIRWYVDGKLTFTRSTSTTTWLTSAFSKPFFVRLNLSVGGSWPGSPDAATAFPADYSIDYLRVYQR